MKPMKQIGGALIAGALACAMAFPAMAEQFVNDEYHTLSSDGTLTIMKSYKNDLCESYGRDSSYNDADPGFYNKIRRVVILKGDGTNVIYQRAFFDCDNLTSIDFSNVDTIQRGAFYDCDGLKTVTIPGNVKTIEGPNTDEDGQGVFQYCVNLTSATLEPGVDEVGKFMFYECENLKSVSIPNTVKVIGRCAFSNTALASVTIPDSVTTIGSDAFSCTQLSSIVIPDSVTKMEGRQFEDCPNLKSITLPASLTSVSKNMFKYFGKNVSGYGATPADVKITFKGTAEQWKSFGVKLPSGVSVQTSTGTVTSSGEVVQSGSSNSSSSPSSSKKTYVTKIKISGKSSLTSGRKTRLKAKVYLKSGASSKYKKVTWSIRSKDKKYASISQSGILKTKKKGKGHTIKVYAKAKDGSGKRAVKKIKIR